MGFSGAAVASDSAVASGSVGFSGAAVASDSVAVSGSAVFSASASGVSVAATTGVSPAASASAAVAAAIWASASEEIATVGPSIEPPPRGRLTGVGVTGAGTWGASASGVAAAGVAASGASTPLSSSSVSSSAGRSLKSGRLSLPITTVAELMPTPPDGLRLGVAGDFSASESAGSSVCVTFSPEPGRVSGPVLLAGMRCAAAGTGWVGASCAASGPSGSVRTDEGSAAGDPGVAGSCAGNSAVEEANGLVVTGRSGPPTPPAGACGVVVSGTGEPGTGEPEVSEAGSGRVCRRPACGRRGAHAGPVAPGLRRLFHAEIALPIISLRLSA